MAKTTNTNNETVEQTETKPAMPAETPMQVTLDEFCQRLSNTVRRPELISGFHYVESKVGRIKDFESSFRARFDAFVNTPV